MNYKKTKLIGTGLLGALIGFAIAAVIFYRINKNLFASELLLEKDEFLNKISLIDYVLSNIPDENSTEKVRNELKERREVLIKGEKSAELALSRTTGSATSP